MRFSIKLLSPLLIISLILLNSCANSPSRQTASSANESSPGIISLLPKIVQADPEMLIELKKSIKNRTKGKTPEEVDAHARLYLDYMLFLGLTANDLKKANAAVISESESELAPVTSALPASKGDDGDTGGEEIDNTPSNLRAVLRLFHSSMQFLNCPVMTDWECLEKSPVFKPTADFRVEKSDVSSPIYAGSSLDMSVYFTQAWDGSPRSGLSDVFTEKISKDAEKSLSLALYGIDDIHGSMKNVYSAIIAKSQNSFTNVRSVVDVMGFAKGGYPYIFSYTNRDENPDKYIFGSGNKIGDVPQMPLTFQYNGTPSFLKELNRNIQNADESKARIEWSTGGIMHNKFAVLENAVGEKSVWTGTANISKNCMGLEANANMAVYIKNTPIAESFLDQFNMMFEFDKTISVKSKLVTKSMNDEQILVGRFHRAKYPRAKRFFTFDDGTQLRVHFAPTDDAEHRVILPMLLSAKEGDEIRISMFGGTGYEIIRAMQFAVARGAHVKIAFDRRLGHGLTSWIRDAKLNVHMNNPYLQKIDQSRYEKPGSLTVRVSTWTGKNHYKAGSLTRKQYNGSMIAEQLIVGSQNWSSGGNDKNDENLISIQNLKEGVKAAELFNREFDNRLWPRSKEEKPFASKSGSKKVL